MGIQCEGQEGGEKKRGGRERKPNMYVLLVDSIQVCAKAENLLRSIWKSNAEAGRLGCTLLSLLKGALIMIVAPCSSPRFDISALAQYLILALWQNLLQAPKSVFGGILPHSPTDCAVMVHYTVPARSDVFMKAPLQCAATDTAVNRWIFGGSLIRPNPRLSLAPTVPFVMH